jgi:hypothetical protein
MQGHRDDGVRAGEHIHAGIPHSLGETPRQRLTRIVLQRVDDSFERVFVETDRRCEMNVGRKAVAAERRRRDDGGPAARADGAARRFVEGRAARGAPRRQEDGQQAVQATP